MISYFIPKYYDGIGDCCIIGYSEGEKIVEKKMTSVLKGICKDRCLDIKCLKEKISNIVHQKNLIPIYLSEGEVFIPIKVREIKASNDGKYGMINISVIDKVEGKYIVLKNGKRIHYLDNRRSINKRMRMTKILKENFDDETIEKKYKQLLLTIKEHILNFIRGIDS